MARTKKVAENTEMFATAPATTTVPTGTTTMPKPGDPNVEIVWPEKAKDAISIKHTYYYVKVRMYFTNSILGLTPNNPKMLDEFMAIKAQKATKRLTNQEKIEETRMEFFQNLESEMSSLAVDEDMIDMIDKGTMIFPKDDQGNPCFFGYQWKGYLKEKIQGGLNRDQGITGPNGDEIGKLKDIRNRLQGISQDVTIVDELNPIFMKEGDVITINQHPIHFDSRVNYGTKDTAIVSCEEIPRGAYTEVIFRVERKGWFPVIKYCLEAGAVTGTGSRRGDGFGTFVFEEVKGSLDCCTLADWRKMIPATKSAAGAKKKKEEEE